MRGPPQPCLCGCGALGPGQYRRGHWRRGSTRYTDEERILSKIELGDDGCWNWAGNTDRSANAGYGLIWMPLVPGDWSHGRRQTGAHRVSYETFVGPIPEGLVLDHLCRNRRCVNPAHLEAVTLAENIRRGEGASARNAAKTHCKHGHEFRPETTKIEFVGGRGWRRVCLECRRAYDRRRWPTRTTGRKEPR